MIWLDRIEALVSLIGLMVLAYVWWRDYNRPST